MTIRFSEFSNKIQNSQHRSKARIVEESIAPTANREEFFSSDKFSRGKTVLSEGKTWEILDKRCNYVVLVSESGKMVKKFPSQIQECSTEMTYAPGTFKGLRVPPAMQTMIESVSDEDPFAIMKAIKAYQEKDYTTVQAVGKTLGADMTEITESSKQEQYQAALIVASAIGCKSTAKDANGVLADIKTTASKGTMSSNQKKIYHDMLGMLTKLGMDTSDKLKEEVSVEPKPTFQDLKKKLQREPNLAPGSSLGASNETHRKQLVRKLQGHD